MTPDALMERARAWMQEDPDPETRRATEVLLERGDAEVLREHFGQTLRFGTAGMRGAMGPGPNRMNRAMVRRVSAGLADYLLATVDGAREQGVVIGYDGRIGSKEFAADAAAVIAARGLVVYLHDDLCPTPQLAHAVTYLSAAAGVMVTASHNPPQDNGYKVYWGNGAQIIPPHDTGISAAFEALTTTPEASAGQDVRPVAPEVLATYLEEVMALRVHDETGVRVVYTAMHGVGCALVQEVLGRAGHDDLHLVAEQVVPDGRFPTVNFPNPEEPGALDLSLALASKVDADLVIANDPDADRLAVAVRTGPGTYRPLSGNQIGVLFAADLLEHGAKYEPGRALVATTIVSSTMLSRIAVAYGAAYAETLTGFKWIANAGLDHEARGGHFVMGYEEALGYSIGPVVRDKDGVSAALLLVDQAAWCKARGETLLDRLAELFRRFGYHASAQHALVLPGQEGAARIASLMDTLRSAPPTAVGDLELTSVRDVLTGEGRDLRTGEALPVDLPTSNVLAYAYGDDVRILARPSGTEPKIKFYFEVRESMGATETLDEVEVRAAARMDDLMAAFLSAAGIP